VQLNTKTKLFAAVDNNAREAKPNTLVSHICLGMPGALPVLNEEVINKAMKVAFAFNTKPQRYSYFERKHYFYPDLPKGYQITQLEQPIVVGGEVNINTSDGQRPVKINRVQIEEDAGKTVHPPGKDYSLVDLNRAGTPLLEIVSEPDIYSAEEAKAYARELWLLMRFTDVSDADMYHGNMRFDVNVSVSKDSKKLGTRTETKNLNSFKSVERAAEYEVERQIERLEKGEKIIQETRGWDDAKQRTLSQRSKEEAHDYRYFPDPDLPPVVLNDEDVDKIEQEMPVLPNEWRNKLASLGFEAAQVEELIEAEAQYEKLSFLESIEKFIEDKDKAVFLANWYVNILVPLLKTDECKLKDDNHLDFEISIYQMLKAKKLSSTNAKVLFVELAKQTELPENIEKYAEDMGYIQVSDEGEIAKIVETVIAANPKAAEDIKTGEMKAIGFLVGQVMKQSKGKADPALAQQLIKKQLGL